MKKVFIILGVISLTGCAVPMIPGMPGTPVQAQPSAQDQEMARLFAQQMIEGMAGRSQNTPQQQANSPAPTKRKSESELLAQYKALPKQAPLVDFEIQKDGLRYNGLMFADPDGPTRQFSVDPSTSTAAYLTREGNVNGTTSGSVKVARIGKSNKIVRVGTYQLQGGILTFTSETGETLRGSSIIPLTDGALILRDSVGFRYVIGSGIDQITIPKGWKVTPLQRGNVASTGYFLIEKTAEAETGATKLLGDFFGKDMKDLIKRGKDIMGAETNDFALVNGQTGNIHYLNFSTSGKETSTGRNCERQNDIVNKCRNFDFYESIWDDKGFRNSGHYFWKVDWQMSSGRAIAVVQENGLMSVNALDLESGKRVSLANRALGISSMNSFINKSGNLGVKISLGFDTQTNDDVLYEIDNREAILKNKEGS